MAPGYAARVVYLFPSMKSSALVLAFAALVFTATVRADAAGLRRAAAQKQSHDQAAAAQRELLAAQQKKAKEDAAKKKKAADGQAAGATPGIEGR